MNRRERLINDIEIFLMESIQLHNFNNTVDKAKYYNLLDRILLISINDFETEEKYIYFFDFINHPNRIIIKSYLNKVFNKEYIGISPFLTMCVYLQGIKNWMK